MSRISILVVDDEYSSRLLITKVLEKENYSIHQCNSALEALNIIKEKSIDLVITDVKMEGMDGIELLRKIRKMETQIAVIILTGYASIQNAIESLRLGAIDYLRKPINIDELSIRVKKAVERIQLEKKLSDFERRLTYSATVTTANHEINQPLTVILSGIDMLKMEFQNEGISSNKVIKYLNLIEKSSLRIAGILRKLRQITSPIILKIPHGMQMIQLQSDKISPKAKEKYILIIEDEEQIRQILKDVLENEGYKVILAENATEGIGIYETQKQFIELILLDFNLPDSTGFNVFKQLKKINADSKILLTSGFEYDSEIQKTLEHGAVGFISKPFNREQIITLIKKFIISAENK